MRCIPIFLLFLFFHGVAFAEDSPVLHIFLVGGQSNAVGVDTANQLSAEWQQSQPEIPFYYKQWPRRNQPDTEHVYTTLRPGAGVASLQDSFGPELSFGPKVADFYKDVRPGDKVALIKFARGGTNLYNQWKPNGTDSVDGDGSVYRMFQEVVIAGLDTLAQDPDLKAYTHRIEAMIWVQGESDLSHGHADEYAENLSRFVQDVRATFKTEFAFYFTRVSDNQTLYPESEDPEKAANFHLIRKRQQEAGETIEGATMVDIDAPRFSMLKQHYYPLYLHFDAAGTIAIGEAFAEAYIADQENAQ